MMKNKETNQQKFIERIKQSLPSNYSLVNELSDLLEISSDSAYRRIRGETTFTFDEIIKICNQYKISFDSFCTNESGVVNFNYNLLLNSRDSFKGYLVWMLENLKRIRQSQIKDIIYAAEDIPLFHSFKFPELSAFKMFYWMKSVLNVPEFEGKKYESSLIDKEFIEYGKQMVDIYSKVPCTEIWSDRTISSTIKQIDYYVEAGFFALKDNALYLCDVLSDVMKDIQKQAECSTKANVAGFEDNYKMYNSDIEIGNNFILVNIDGIKSVFLRNYTFNSMVTTNAAFCDETEQWLKGIIKKSTLISGVAEKQRHQFFQKVLNKIEELRERIK